MEKYDHKKIESKWQKEWKESGMYTTEEKSSKPKSYVLDMFPYPSGEGLHVGHPKGYIATDVYSRFKKMSGFNVLHPMGWDAFGLPAEQYAIKNKIHPSKAVEKNVARFKEQLSVIGLNYDWERELSTTDPNFYKWTQWIFLKLFEKGLAYESYEPINWCPSCQTGLSNEDLEGNACERCGTIVEKKPMRQWVLRITDYADRMLADIDALEWPDSIKESQRNWIGRNYGLKYKLKVKGQDRYIETYSTHYEAFCADTFAVIASDHKLLPELIADIPERETILQKAKEISALRSGAGFKGDELCEGVFTGIYLEDPITKRDLPLWVSSYALADYGTGIVKCSAHDERDFVFAKTYNIKLSTVLLPDDISLQDKVKDQEICFSDFEHSVILEPEEFKGKKPHEVREAIADHIQHHGWGTKSTQYKLKDWVFSRQRYWGEPMPVVHCEACKNKKQKVLLVHGFEGSPNGNWMPWMKTELEMRGFEVFAPELPNAGHPDMDAWLGVLLPILKNFGEEDIVIGHSLGGKAAVHTIEKAGKKLKHVFLVASAIGEIESRDWENMKAGSPNSDITTLQKFWQAKTNYETVSGLANVTVIISDNDPYISQKTNKDIPREWNFKVWRGFKHFQGKQAPELLKEFLRFKNTGVVAVPEKDLPVKLPEVEFYEPTGTGESPLANIDSWVNVKCPKCGGEAKRETNTMPQWAGSSWYYLRFIDPKNSEALVDKEKEKYWSPVDMYVGGAEHATRHLIYARFWHKFLYDIGAVNYTEPFMKLHNVGLILAEDGRKMSKRWGNVVNPDTVVDTYGADTLRLYEMFMGPFNQSCAWSTESMIGPRRFLEKVWKISEKVSKDVSVQKEIETIYHRTIKKVSEDIEAFKFNTAISQMMIFVNELDSCQKVSQEMFEGLLVLLTPFAPHMTEELWHVLGHATFIYNESWPAYDEAKIKNEAVTIAIQVNGKLRDTITIARDTEEEAVKKTALESEKIRVWTHGKEIKKVIYVKEKLVSIVV